MASDEKCPMCDTPRKQTAYWGACEVCGHCGLPVRLWENVRMIRRQAEIGMRAVEVLNQRWFWNQTDVLESLMADARAAGMIP